MIMSRIVLASLLLVSQNIQATADTAQAGVDRSFDAVQAAVATAGLQETLQIDHARLADVEGVEMPAARVQIFSDPSVNTALLQQDLRIGLDLPFRVLSFDAAGITTVSYTSSAFLAARHGVSDAAALSGFDAQLEKVLGQLGTDSPEPVSTTGVSKGFAILELQSRYDVAETAARLKEAVTAQSDTIWFGDLDFQSEAADLGVTLKPARLLLFGGPAPGGVAMAQYPGIGLDAFCQKLLVYEGADGNALVLFNDIEALANLHYGSSIPPHKMLNERLTATFRAAIE